MYFLERIKKIDPDFKKLYEKIIGNKIHAKKKIRKKTR
jgi:hypothetical protein